MIRKEERARDMWEATNMHLYTSPSETLVAPNAEDPALVEYAETSEQAPFASTAAPERTMDASIYNNAIRISSPRFVC